ncbi:MAG: helix-turn-helix domain-containing GNAT family N-acetyltransferase [Desulfobacterales bacterium]|jgi:DNA-binding MarR family transcriptional regulator/ribosomal protein S18 acetylase RimI-like enzyme
MSINYNISHQKEHATASKKTMMSKHDFQEAVARYRKFNRFYTKQIGLLNQGLLETRFPLIQARVLYELAQQDQTTASVLVGKLNIDPGYLSRILSTFQKEGLLHKSRSTSDSRQRILKLTTRGKKSYAELDERSRNVAEEMLRDLAEEDRHRLLHAMQTIETLLDAEPKPPAPFLLRSHRPGDIGWIIHRHGVVYAEEYGFDETFEALVAEILVEFIRNHDPRRECLWIAEQAGHRIGSIMIVDAGDRIAQLRLLLVEPKTRDQRVGTQLIDACINFSNRHRYRKIKLWTQSNLLAARHLYVKKGFEKVSQSPHKSFGQNLIAEIWELRLGG